MSRNLRRRKFIDFRLQGLLCLRAVFYWMFCVLSLCLMGLVWRMFIEPSALFESGTVTLLERYAPVFAGALLLVPVLIFDCIGLSNRFAGPIYRLRGAMRDLAEGRSTNPIHFRQGDFWCDLADDFNRVASRVEVLEARLAALEFDGGEQDSSIASIRWPGNTTSATSPRIAGAERS